VRNANVDDTERMCLLTTYKECMANRFKENEKKASDLRKDVVVRLLKGLSYRSIDVGADGQTYDKSEHHIVYELCGVLLHARSKAIDSECQQCMNCWSSLLTQKDLLPPTFGGHLQKNVTRAD
jgi:hypothetical protein